MVTGRTSHSPDSEVFAHFRTVMPGGVSASMRMHPYVGQPVYIERGEGAYLYGATGTRYIDLNMSNGAALPGHCHPAEEQAIPQGLAAGIIAAVETPLQAGLTAGAMTAR